MKILFVVNDLDFFFSHRLPLAIELISRGNKVHVISNKIPNENISKIVFHSFKIHRTKRGLINNLISILQLNKIINSINPKLIHSVTLKPILFSSLILFFNKKIRLINAVSGLGFLFIGNRFSSTKFIVKSIFRLIIKFREPFFIFQNKDDLYEFKKLGLKKNYKLIKGSGVDQNDFLYSKPKDKSKINITFTGRILKDKGIIELIEGFNFLPKNLKSKTILNIYGKIDNENPASISQQELEKLIRNKFIKWHGHTRNIKKVLINSDIYCLPSHREGLPKSIVEAMAIGRPIITTNSPGCKETVVEGVNGFKVEVGESKNLSKIFQTLINDKELRNQMGKNSRSLFEKEFTLKKIIEMTFEVYNEVFKT